MSPAVAIVLFIVAAYVAGATPFGYLAGRLKGVDIREHGSGNIGATNAIRVLGKGVGIPVFILDALKGFLPVCALEWWLVSRGFASKHWHTDLAMVAAGFATVLGHNYTFWLRGRGGKGVATSAGVMLALAPLSLAIAFGVWLITFAASRYVSLASMVAAVALPTAMAFRSRSWPVLVLGVAMAVLTIWRHRGNIERLRAGTEPRAGGKTKEVAP